MILLRKQQLRILLATASLTALWLGAATGPGYAADAAPPALKAPTPPARSWAGFYLGATAGYGWKRDEFFVDLSQGPFVPLPSIDGIRSRGAVYGGYAGYNWQYGRFAPGVEIDFTARDNKGAVDRAGTSTVQ